MGQERERGYPVCTDGKKITRGPTVNGDRTSVKIPNSCPSGTRRVALFHTHTSGNIHYSDQDIRAARQTKTPMVCVKANNKVKCYRVTTPHD